MGDRANIALIPDNRFWDEQIWLYTHWGGSTLFDNLQIALKRGEGRWGDESYLARIIYSEMIPAAARNELTGYGLSTRITDNEYPVLAIDMLAQRVFLVAESDLVDGKVPPAAAAATVAATLTESRGFSWTYEEFVKLPSDPRAAYTERSPG